MPSSPIAGLHIQVAIRPIALLVEWTLRWRELEEYLEGL